MVNFESLADLDELIIKCRNQRSKEYIAEAVACYKAGAYRSCIVATWIAIVFDYINKLKELDLIGDKNAKARLDDFSRICERNDILASLNFERKILDDAKNIFELLTPLDYEDLSRLQNDRNRCAHPSMLSIDEPYKPSAELARYHLRNAVIHFLQCPPVQGKNAFDRIMSDINSDYFPIDHILAKKHFESGPLVRAKNSLIRSIIKILTQDLIREKYSQSKRDRYFSALKAINDMYPNLTERFIEECLPETVRIIEDADLNKVIEYIYNISVSWDLLGSPGQIKACEYIRCVNVEEIQAISYAAKIIQLKSIAISRIGELSSNSLAEFIKVNPIKEVAVNAVNFFVKSRSFNSAFFNFQNLILPIASLLSIEQVKEVVNSFTINNQIYGSGGMPNLYVDFFNKTLYCVDLIKEEWGLLCRFLQERFYEEELVEVIEAKFPEFKQQ
jgi:hypothetical protein